MIADAQKDAKQFCIDRGFTEKMADAIFSRYGNEGEDKWQVIRDAIVVGEARKREIAERTMADLLIEALPYVEAAQDGDEYDKAGKARAKALAADIRKAIEVKK